MHSSALLPTILVALLASPSPSPAQSSAESPAPPEAAPAAETPEKPSKRDLFFDPDDGKLDFSRFLAGKKGFLPVGGLITEPAVGFGATLGLMFLQDSIANRAEQTKKRGLERLLLHDGHGVGREVVCAGTS